ncbi:oxygenase MpaB family protein [Spirillospora sp. NPDC047279]|uniref:oxygenase MpaB family protein n=1 Tax=Spirillospora sp. NPDC047279 TaxID=3155478 RepID=UPI0033CCC196
MELDSSTRTRARPAGSIPDAESLMWRYAGDWRAGLLGRGTLLLQVAHPVVGAGVADHSEFLEDRWGRLLRTVESTTRFLGYRGDEAGRREAARLRELHKDIKGVDAQGRRYHALDPEAYLWVHATLLHGMLQAQSLFARPLRPGTERRLFAEWRELAFALGVTERHVPGDPAAFRRYFDTMVNERLEDNATVQLLIELDHRPLPPPPRWPLPDLAWKGVAAPSTARLRRLGIGSLPPVLRERFGLSWTAADERGFQRFARRMRMVDGVLAEPLRVSPVVSRARRSARRRAAG